MKPLVVACLLALTLTTAGSAIGSSCDDPFGCGGDGQQTTKTGGGHLKTLAYKTAKTAAIKKANRITGYHHGRATTMLRMSRVKWYAQVTETDTCWIGMDVFLRAGAVRTRVSENFCDTSGDSSDPSADPLCQSFPDIDYHPSDPAC